MFEPINDFLTFVYRILFLYFIFMLCRVGFYFYNFDLLGPVLSSEYISLFKGSLVYDSASIFYLNLPFLFFSLIPFRFRERKSYQNFLMWIFIVTNSFGLAVNIADIFYYPFKMGRIAWDDVHFLFNGNFGLLLLSFFRDYWYGFFGWIGLGAILWLGFRKIGYRPKVIRNNFVYYISQSLLLAASSVIAVIFIRGGNISSATYPININDAGLYASPEKSGLIVSNPFALIRTSGHNFNYPEYFPENELDAIFIPVHYPPDSAAIRVEGTPNIMMIILESFATPHIKELSDQFDPDDPSYTPFLDSVIRESYVFRNGYHNGIRSIDALPSLWASIPSFRSQFLSFPQSAAPYHALPECLKDIGYTTAFMHGAVRESMSFVAFGKTVGVQHFVSREEYEADNGKKDFDGQWGIWDHMFFPYVVEKMAELPQPFFNTMFSLSSHHPFRLPQGFEGRYPEGNLPIHKMIGYSDEALRNMFYDLARYEWFENTIFIFVADHGSGSDNEKYRRVPFSFSVPIVFYSPGGLLPKGMNERVAGHIDILPTILGMLGYDKPFFAFGKDLFNYTDSDYTINYMGAFNTITDSLVYIFNEREFVAVYDYRNDPLQENNLISTMEENDPVGKWTKAFIQQYYRHIRNRNFLPPDNSATCLSVNSN